MLKFKSQINFNCKIKKKKLQWKFLDERYFEKQLFVAKFESSFREIRRRFEKGGKSRARCTSGKFRERGAYWKVLRSIKSFSRVIITRHWFKPISPDDSSSSNFWRLHSSLYPSPVRSIDDPNALRVGRRQLDAQKNAPRSDSPLNPYLSYTPLNSWLTILFASTISFLFYYLESIQDYAELGMEKLFREEINEVDSIRQTQVRQTWRNFLKILIKKKYIRTYFRQSRFIKLNIFGCAHNWQLHASIVRLNMISKQRLNRFIFPA